MTELDRVGTKATEGLAGFVAVLGCWPAAVIVNFAYRSADRSSIMTSMNTKAVAPEVRRLVRGSRDRFWRPEDFEGHPDAVAQALSRMVHAGDLRRVRRGLYWRGASTPLGMAPPPPSRLVGKVAGGTGSGPSGWSAALALGLSTQVARREAIALPRRAPRSPGNVRLVSRAASTKRRDENLRPAEVALLEVLRDWENLVEVPTDDAVVRIDRLSGTGDLRLERVARAADTEPPRVREGLRRLLGALGRPEIAGTVRPARSESARNGAALAFTG